MTHLYWAANLLCFAVWGLEECGLEGSRFNIFMGSPTGHLLSDQLATLESVYYNYPSANLVIVGSVNLDAQIAHSKGYCLSFYDALDEFGDNLPLFLKIQFTIYTLQYKFGGLYIPFDGGLVNTLEYVLGSRVIVSSVYQEIVGGGQNPDAFQREDYDQMAWTRSWMDRHEGSSVLCSLHCIRLVVKGDNIGAILLEGIYSVHPDVRLTKHIKEHSMNSTVILPNWLIAETKFPDHWNTFGSTPGYVNPSTDLHSPREHRYRQDYWLVVSNKLWVPWLAGSGEELNTLPLSVTSLVKQQFSLEIFTPFYVPLFGKRVASGDIVIKSPFDQIERLMTTEQILMRKYFHVRDIGLPGNIGGYRTFRHLKIVTKTFNFVNVTVVGAPLTCRNEHRMCLAHILDGVFTFCDYAAEVNTALSQLAYIPKSESGYFNLSVSAQGVESCSDQSVGTNLPSNAVFGTNFTALSTDPSASVTVIAHSAERCFLLKRMMDSVNLVYPKMRGIVTCECEPKLFDCPTTPQLVLDVHPNTDWYVVPYDFGLSRGKEFAISKVETEFILVLDDDFVLGFNSCIECLISRMSSRTHSAAWLPLDIVGFPVLEDERSFGAFRGTLRVADSKFFLEPFTHQSTPDGCVRVDICPMVFLGRTVRMKTLRWNHELPVGEHEEFFYANKYNGLQVGVCMDTSFVHLRWNATLNDDYAIRRARMRTLMSDTFSNVGIGQTYYFFHKYSHVDYADFEQLASKGINPYSVYNDGGGPRDVTFSNMKLAYVAIISSISESSRSTRMFLRLEDSLLSTLVSDGVIEFIFLIPSSGRGVTELLVEEDQFRDIIWIPQREEIQLKFIMEFFRRYMFQFLLIIDDHRVFPTLRSILTKASLLPNREMIFAHFEDAILLSRDMHALFSEPINLKRLKLIETNRTIFESAQTWSQPYSTRNLEL